MNKATLAALTAAILITTACGGESESADGAGQSNGGNHAHETGSDHEPHGEGSHADHEEAAPETEAYYGNDEQPAAEKRSPAPEEKHGHDGDHGHSH